MRLVSEIEANLVSGGSFLASDSFDGGGGGGGGFSAASIATVYVTAPAASSSIFPEWTEFGAGAAVLGFALLLAAAAPATPIITIAVIVSSYWGGVIVSDSFQGGVNFQP